MRSGRLPGDASSENRGLRAKAARRPPIPYTRYVSKWVHLAVAPDQITAEIWLDILRQEGVIAMIRPSDAVSYLGVSAVSCRIQTLEEDLARAREVLGPEAD